MISFLFFVYCFVIMTWVCYGANSLYVNHKMAQFFPKKRQELLTIPFYIFYIASLVLSIQGIWNQLALPTNINATSMTIIIFGVCLCVASQLLFTYVNFFEASFPSCLSANDNKPLKGIYTYIRHPSYYVFFLVTFGVACCMQSTLLFILAIINHISLYICYALEEKQMAHKSPLYKNYLSETHRFLPRLRKII